MLSTAVLALVATDGWAQPATDTELRAAFCVGVFNQDLALTTAGAPNLDNAVAHRNTYLNYLASSGALLNPTRKSVAPLLTVAAGNGMLVMKLCQEASPRACPGKKGCSPAECGVPLGCFAPKDILGPYAGQ